MKKKDLNTPLSKMTYKQLERGVRQWLEAGTTNDERDQEIQKQVNKKLASAKNNDEE